MKRISLLALVSLVMISCSEPDNSIEGYIVFKKHVPRHMCHDDVQPVVEAGFTHVHVHTTHPHHHTEQEPEWTLYIGNANGTKEVDVTENCYSYFHVTDKVIYDSNGLHLVKKGCR